MALLLVQLEHNQLLMRIVRQPETDFAHGLRQFGDTTQWRSGSFVRIAQHDAEAIAASELTDNSGGHLQSSLRLGFDPTFEIGTVGFRVSSLADIPEPSHVGGLMGSLAFLMAWCVKGRR